MSDSNTPNSNIVITTAKNSVRAARNLATNMVVNHPKTSMLTMFILGFFARELFPSLVSWGFTKIISLI